LFYTLAIVFLCRFRTSMPTENDADEARNDECWEKEQQNQASATRRPLQRAMYGVRRWGRVRGFRRRRRVDRVSAGLL